ncbi:MAG: CaiB/BaiF CoA-transferase family protein [Acidocella sp.]|nr:CaiB/BaiF CoA-transferase family protein [Acidocella sp.]
MNLPLSGISVLSLEQAIAAPMASRHLADWGARVIKIERPGSGDFCRGYDHAMHGISSQFVWTNRSKESLAIDLKSEFGQQTLEALLPQADVFLQNLAPGAAAKMGLDAKTLLSRFPRLIACDISGYGTGGPYQNKKAYDLLVQCETGFLSINGTPETQAKSGLSIVDIATGMYTLQGVLMALYNRERTGAGTAFEVSLFDAMGEWMSYPAYYTRDGGVPLQRTGARHATISPYGPFRTGDGKTIFFGIQNEREWLSFCKLVMADTAMASDPRFISNPARMANRDTLEAAIEAAFSAWTSDEVIEKLEAAAIANARLNSVEDFIKHPQLHERQRLRTVNSETGPQEVFLPAVTIPGVEPVMGPVPALGEHNDKIFAELGLTAPHQAA